MKKPRKSTFQKEQTIPKENMASRKSFSKILILSIGGLLFSLGLLFFGWYLGRQDEDTLRPYQALKGYETSRHSFMVKSAEISVKLAKRAVEDIKNRKIIEAIQDCKTSIDIFPIDAKPYILLTKLYLTLGQEQKMFDVLNLAGRSYPDFDNIVDVIDDESLDKLPLENSEEDIYLANFHENKKMAMCYMFDDGEANVYKALPIFEKFGYKATIPVVAGFVADKSNDPFWGSWFEWKDASNRGFEIADHSMYHRDEKNMHGIDFDVAIDQAQKEIEKNIGHEVTTYVFPHDSYTDESVARALRTHKAVRTPEFLRKIYNREIEIVFGGPHFSLQTGNRLIDIGIKRRLWVIAKCHGVTEKRTMRSFKSISPGFLEGNLSYIHSKSEDVWLDTFADIFDYMSLRSQTAVENQEVRDASIDFVLRNKDVKAKLIKPLTVVIKAGNRKTIKSAVEGADKHMLKSWDCEEGKLCVDVDAYDQNVHLQW